MFLCLCWTQESLGHLIETQRSITCSNNVTTSDGHKLVLFKTCSLFTVLFSGSLRSVVQLHSLSSVLSRGGQTGSGFCPQWVPNPLCTQWSCGSSSSGLWAVVDVPEVRLAQGCWGETGVCQGILPKIHWGFYKPKDSSVSPTLVSWGLLSSDQVCYSSICVNYFLLTKPGSSIVRQTQMYPCVMDRVSRIKLKK